MDRCGCGLRIADYDHWPSRLAEDGRWVFAFPLYSVRMKRCGLLSLALQACRGWAMDLRFPSLFSEDEMMWIVIVGPLGRQRMGDGSLLPLCI